ncbi:MAG: hypothetical protein WD939_10000, partial [Dehalococcoidia bacterium]
MGAMIALIGLWLASSLASAGGASVAVGSATRAVGAQGTVALDAAGVGAPGLGAWTIDINYNPAVVSPVDCDAFHGGICNTDYDTGIVRLVG